MKLKICHLFFLKSAFAIDALTVIQLVSKFATYEKYRIFKLRSHQSKAIKSGIGSTTKRLAIGVNITDYGVTEGLATEEPSFFNDV